MENKTNNEKTQACGIRDYVITLTVAAEDFAMSTGRAPRNQDEFNTWGRLLEKGLCNGHLDWDILYECATEALAKAQADEAKIQTTGAGGDA